jgi:hypothetical protein
MKDWVVLKTQHCAVGVLPASIPPKTKSFVPRVRRVLILKRSGRPPNRLAGNAIKDLTPMLPPQHVPCVLEDTTMTVKGKLHAFSVPKEGMALILVPSFLPPAKSVLVVLITTRTHPLQVRTNVWCVKKANIQAPHKSFARIVRWGLIPISLGLTA